MSKNGRERPSVLLKSGLKELELWKYGFQNYKSRRQQIKTTDNLRETTRTSCICHTMWKPCPHMKENSRSYTVSIPFLDCSPRILGILIIHKDGNRWDAIEDDFFSPCTSTNMQIPLLKTDFHCGLPILVSLLKAMGDVPAQFSRWPDRVLIRTFLKIVRETPALSNVGSLAIRGRRSSSPEPPGKKQAPKNVIFPGNPVST